MNKEVFKQQIVDSQAIFKEKLEDKMKLFSHINLTGFNEIQQLNIVEMNNNTFQQKPEDQKKFI